MPWTREQAIEMGRKGARKGGLARAARLSPERRFDIAVIASAARWQLTSELELIDRQLTKLAITEAWARKAGDAEAYRRTIQAQLPWLRMRMWARRQKEADDIRAEQRRQDNGEWQRRIQSCRDEEWVAWLRSHGLPTPSDLNKAGNAKV